MAIALQTKPNFEWRRLFCKSWKYFMKKTLARLKLLAQFCKTYLLLRSICFQWHLVRKHFCVICSHNNTAKSFPSVSARMFCRRDIEVIARLSVAIRDKAQQYWSKAVLDRFEATSGDLWSHIGNLLHRNLSLLIRQVEGHPHCCGATNRSNFFLFMSLWTGIIFFILSNSIA